MKKISIFALFIIFAALVLLPKLSPAQPVPNIDYTTPTLKELIKKSMWEKQGNKKLEWGNFKENLIYKNFIFALYDATIDGEKRVMVVPYIQKEEGGTKYSFIKKWGAYKEYELEQLEKDLLTPEGKKKVAETLFGMYGSTSPPPAQKTEPDATHTPPRVAPSKN